jgi:adenylate cyclase class IV
MPLAPRRNIELKARDLDPGESLRACLKLGASDHGTISQRDTYFHAPCGGLKLREEDPGSAHLIQFSRADSPQQHESRYRIAEVTDAGAVVAVLTDAIGIWGTVLKQRHLLLWENVRIHLDEVETLGSFIELEAVAPADSDLSREYELVAQLRDVLQITDDRLEAHGYARQLLPTVKPAPQ